MDRLAVRDCGRRVRAGEPEPLRAARDNRDPQNRPTRLVTGGPFAISRNPMYIALTLAYCAAAVLLARAWPLVVLAIPLCVIDRVVIPFEERRMREVFGEAYADYCRRVRRWL
jgi:protein-S-isoprenylcysteine O-methyltransferase Ste14